MLKKLILAVALFGFVGAVTLPSLTIAQTTTTQDIKYNKSATLRAPLANP